MGSGNFSADWHIPARYDPLTRARPSSPISRSRGAYPHNRVFVNLSLPPPLCLSCPTISTRVKCHRDRIPHRDRLILETALLINANLPVLSLPPLQSAPPFLPPSSVRSLFPYRASNMRTFIARIMARVFYIRQLSLSLAQSAAIMGCTIKWITNRIIE